VDWDASHEAISATLLEVFAAHESESVQHSIWVMATAMLERHAEIDEVRMSLPNLHHWPVDLVPLGGANRGEIFVATIEPHGLIEATVRRPAS
jgi:urate oxidase